MDNSNKKAKWLEQCLPIVIQPTIDVKNGCGLVCAFAQFEEENYDPSFDMTHNDKKSPLNCVVNLIFKGKANYFRSRPTRSNIIINLFKRSLAFMRYKHTTDIKQIKFININLEADGPNWESIQTKNGSKNQTWVNGDETGCSSSFIPYEIDIKRDEWPTEDDVVASDIADNISNEERKKLLETPIYRSAESCIPPTHACGSCIVGTEDLETNCTVRTQSDEKKLNVRSTLEHSQKPILYVNTMNHLMYTKNQNIELAKTIWESFPVFKGSMRDAEVFSKSYIPYKMNLFCCCAESCCCCCYHRNQSKRPTSWNGMQWTGKKYTVGRYWKGIIFTFIMIMLFSIAGRNAYRILHSSIYIIDEWFRTHILQGLTIYFTVIVFGVMLFMPLSLIEIFGGFVLGPMLSVPLGILAKQIGSILCFYIGRLVLCSRAARIVSDHQSLCMLGHIICDNQWKMVLLIRFMLLPLGATSYGLGPLKISFKCFFSTSLLAMLPYSILFGTIGNFSKTLLDVADGRMERSAGYVTMGIGGVSIAAFVLLLYILTKRALHEKDRMDLHLPT